MLKRSVTILGSLAFAVVLLFACANSGSDGGSPGVVTMQGDSGAGQDASQDASGDAGFPDTGPGSPDTGPMGMGIIPTTCGEANGSAGCCGPDGKNYYCFGDAGTVSSKGCSVTEAGVALVCGWNSTKGYYGCVTPPGEGDPSGADPLACGSAKPDSGTTVTDSGSPADSGTVTDSGTVADTGTPAEGGNGGTPTTCAQANSVVGCCGANGDNYYCPSDGGALTTTACTSPKVCGWSATKMYYACVAAPGLPDPSGTNPLACQ